MTNSKPMTKLILVTSLVILAFFHSCQQKDTYSNIDPNTKMKFKLNDTLIFKSILRTDSFRISAMADGYFISDKTDYREYLKVGYQKININQSEDSIFKDKSWYCTQRGAGTDASIIWRNLYGWPNLSYYNKKDTSLQIDDLIIKNVQYLFAFPGLTKYSNDIIKVYYCHLYGIIQYERNNGEVFILESKYIRKYIK